MLYRPEPVVTKTSLFTMTSGDVIAFQLPVLRRRSMAPLLSLKAMRWLLRFSVRLLPPSLKEKPAPLVQSAVVLPVVGSESTGQQ